MDSNTNALNWFEIPATDIRRSKQFYESIFGITLIDHETEDSKMAMFPWSENSEKVAGSLVQSAESKPSMEGSIVYLNANSNLQQVLDKVEPAGGKVLMPKTSIGEHGNIAFIADTEGNKVGLHSS